MRHVYAHCATAFSACIRQLGLLREEKRADLAERAKGATHEDRGLGGGSSGHPLGQASPRTPGSKGLVRVGAARLRAAQLEHPRGAVRRFGGPSARPFSRVLTGATNELATAEDSLATYYARVRTCVAAQRKRPRIVRHTSGPRRLSKAALGLALSLSFTLGACWEPVVQHHKRR